VTVLITRLSNLLSLLLWLGEICLSAAKILAISHASTKTQLSEISMTPFMHLLWPSVNNQTLLIHRQTLISEWIGQMPAVLDEHLLWIDIFFWYSTKVQITGPLNPQKHEARELQSNYWNNTLLHQAVRLATCALITQKNSPRKKWWIFVVKMTSFCNLWSRPPYWGRHSPSLHYAKSPRCSTQI